MTHLQWRYCIGFLVYLICSEVTTAGGFAIIPQGGSVVGSATAGAAAIADDASTIYYNPAGLSRLTRNEVLSGIEYVTPRGRFKNMDSKDAVGGFLLGGDGGDPDGSLIPSIYVALVPMERLRFGLGVNSPFGQSTVYENDWIGRYHAQKSELETININPVIAYRISESFSLGVGLNAQRLEIELSNALDFGSLCVSRLGAVCPGVGLTPQGADGQVTVTGDDWGFGYNAGMLWETGEVFRLGISYRSAITVDLRGNADFTVPSFATPLTNGGTLFRDTTATAKLTLPESLQLGLYGKLTPHWEVMATVLWTRWSRIQNTVISFGNPLQPTTIIESRWDDTFFYSLGAAYRLSDTLRLLAGIAYDESPTPDEFRSPRLPGSDTLIFAFGADYRRDHLGILLNVSYQNSESASINLSDANAGHLKGEFDLSALLLGMSLQWKF